MITFLNGKLVEKTPTYIILECNGIGYFINVSLNTSIELPEVGANLLIHTYLHVREDAITLFGFHDKLEREVFTSLITVSGVGATTARTMLSSLTAQEVCNAIANEQIKTIQKAKGIGLKTAQRIIVDLKDKITKIGQHELITDASSNKNQIIDEAISALEVLGFNKKTVEKIVEKIVEEDKNITVENIIKLTLKKM